MLEWQFDGRQPVMDLSQIHDYFCYSNCCCSCGTRGVVMLKGLSQGVFKLNLLSDVFARSRATRHNDGPHSRIFRKKYYLLSSASENAFNDYLLLFISNFQRLKYLQLKFYYQQKMYQYKSYQKVSYLLFISFLIFHSN